jgi:hypothetical protein
MDIVSTFNTIYLSRKALDAYLYYLETTQPTISPYL